MNVYLLVEGAQTEKQVYPAWLSIIAPNLKRVERLEEFSNNNYLEEIDLPITFKVEDLNKNVFSNCNSLKNIHI